MVSGYCYLGRVERLIVSPLDLVIFISAGSMSSMEDGRSLSPIDEPTAVATSLLANVKEINRVRQQVELRYYR